MANNTQIENIEFMSFKELLNSDIAFMTELGDDIFIKVKSDDPYDNVIWKYNKKTERIGWMLYTTYILTVSDQAVELDPMLFKSN